MAWPLQFPWLLKTHRSPPSSRFIFTHAGWGVCNSSPPCHCLFCCLSVNLIRGQGRNMFKGFSSSAECRLLMSHSALTAFQTSVVRCVHHLEPLCSRAWSQNIWPLWRKKKQKTQQSNMTYSYSIMQQNKFSRQCSRRCIGVNRLKVECIKSFSALCSAKLQMTSMRPCSVKS